MCVATSEADCFAADKFDSGQKRKLNEGKKKDEAQDFANTFPLFPRFPRFLLLPISGEDVDDGGPASAKDQDANTNQNPGCRGLV